jgi:glycine/D-amino acid oxidase-like deaminating enzyme
VQSVWLKDYRSQNYRTDKKNAEVIIIGAGLSGLLTAWQLLQSGLDVLVLEAREIGQGTSGHTTGKITSQHRIFYHQFLQDQGEEKGRIYAEANQWAVQEYIDLIKRENIQCHLQVLPAYVYSDEDPQILELENQIAQKLGLPSSMESVPVSTHKALCFSNQAQFHSVEFMQALAQRIVSKGGAIAEHKRVIAVQEKETCKVSTEDGEVFQSDYVVYATLFPILDYGYYATRLIPVQHFGIAYTYEKREFEGVYIGINDISFRYHENYLITIGADQKMGHAEGAYQELDKRVKAKFRVKEQLIRWSAHDQNSGDLVPYIGIYHPDSKRSFAATGFKAWGITHAMVAARIITDLISGRQNRWSSLFYSGRTTGALKTAAQQTKSVIEEMVKFGKRCTHMGCTLADNSEDDTFDCPCHGSRFDKTGQILWGPAVKKL